jgi:hypothetical protein
MFISSLDGTKPDPTPNSIPFMVDIYASPMSTISPSNDELSNTAVIHEYLYALAMRRGYKKRDDTLYKPIYNNDGVYVFAMEVDITIDEFVNREINGVNTRTMWDSMISSGKRKSIITDLTNIYDPRLPEFKPPRRVFSFQNGILFLGPLDLLSEEEDTSSCKFLEFTDPSIPPNLVAANYFDEYFDPDWLNRENDENTPPPPPPPTPNIDSIFHYQEMGIDVINILYALTGRLVFYALKELGEHWQVAPFLYGHSRTGKGTYGQFLLNIYPSGLCSAMGNQNEERFGLAPYKDKFFIIGMEIKSTFTMDEANFNSMISAEAIEAPRKNKTPLSIREWPVGMMLCGNEIPGFDGTGGCLENRLVYFHLSKEVKDKNSKLPSLMAHEMPAFLIKCFYAYHALLTHIGHRGFYDDGVIPDYFFSVRNHIQAQTDPFRDFLESSDKLIFSKELDTLRHEGKLDTSSMPDDLLKRIDEDNIFIPKLAFMSLLKDHCNDNALTMPRFRSDHHGPILQKHSCLFVSGSKRYTYHAGARTTTFIKGCDKRAIYESYIQMCDQ